MARPTIQAATAGRGAEDVIRRHYNGPARADGIGVPPIAPADGRRGLGHKERIC